MNPVFFGSPVEFRSWLENNHASASELWVGFHKKKTGRPTLTWNESVDEALCFGWIDGIRKSIDDDRYVIRFTPRKPGSTWSLKNVKRIRELIDEKRVAPAGRRAFEAMKPEKSGVYSFEREHASLAPAELKLFKANRKAWRFFEQQPPGYRKVATHWVVSAKREETRKKRLQILIEDSANALRIASLRRTK